MFGYCIGHSIKFLISLVMKKTQLFLVIMALYTSVQPYAMGTIPYAMIKCTLFCVYGRTWQNGMYLAWYIIANISSTQVILGSKFGLITKDTTPSI